MYIYLYPTAAGPRRARNGEARQHARAHTYMHVYLRDHTDIVYI